MYKISRNNKIRKFFEIIANNDLSTKEKAVEFVREKQLEAHKVGVFSDEGVAARIEQELMFEGLNYLADLKDTAVKDFLIDYFK